MKISNSAQLFVTSSAIKIVTYNVGSAAMYLQRYDGAIKCFLEGSPAPAAQLKPATAYRYPKYTKTSDFVYPNAKVSNLPDFRQPLTKQRQDLMAPPYAFQLTPKVGW